MKLNREKLEKKYGNYTGTELLSHVDHTLLKQTATEKDIEEICIQAKEGKTASVCIPPCYVSFAKAILENEVKVCTVIGFPNGNCTTETKIFETKNAIENGADEIDMVINVGMLKAGNKDYTVNEIRSVKNACGTRILKVIIETCLLEKEEIVKASEAVTEAGADYVKTSTGFSSGGAKIEDVMLMKKTVGDKAKVKAAGGIRSIEDAVAFLEAGADRLGTSSLYKLFCD